MELKYDQVRPLVSSNHSMLYAILPSAVQSRLPKLPSLRSSASSLYGLYGTRTPQKLEFDSGSSSVSGSSSSSGTATPDINYKDALVLGVFSPSDQSSGVALCENSANRQVGMQMSNDEFADDKSGIQWKFAHQGLNLLSLAVNESSTVRSRSTNASFARQVYLHAATYLLQGLPADLTMEEQLSLRSSLPPGLVEPIRVEVNDRNTSGKVLQRERSILHRTLSSSIVQLFILFQFLLPYFTYVIAVAYQYDREHKIVQRSIAQGMETFDKVGRRGMALAGTFLEMGDGKVGEVVGEITTWIIEGVAGGIQEGVGEAMVIAGSGKAQGFQRS